MPNLEHDFAAWTEHRDLAALTRVFDATAGRLLLLATHITTPQSAPEDLVQATFMTAMEKSATWDRSRPIWPWLATILQNKARMDWRRTQRRREIDINATTALSADGPDPATLAASDDAFNAIVRSIDDLPVEYRQILRLRLVHGLAHGEIAHTLELPVGTVRARTHRGLARLRSALPAHVGGGALAALFASEGALLAQVRTRVLATASPTTLPPTLLGGVLTMKTVIPLALAALGLLAIAGLLWPTITESSAGTDDATSTHTATVADDGQTTTAAKTTEIQRQSLGAQSAAVWPLLGLVHTRDQEPIATRVSRPPTRTDASTCASLRTLSPTRRRWSPPTHSTASAGHRCQQPPLPAPKSRSTSALSAWSAAPASAAASSWAMASASAVSPSPSTRFALLP